ncbi:MAG: hypothetical protein IE922_06175 [Sphingomonadales bacterium]|nr:hypothetical protein [Sphingomonadales bacterium]
MTAYLLPDAAHAAETAETRAAALIAGPCALPAAPMAMPPQVIEAEAGLLRRLVSLLLPQRPATPSAGAGA